MGFSEPRLEPRGCGARLGQADDLVPGRRGGAEEDRQLEQAMAAEHREHDRIAGLAGPREVAEVVLGAGAEAVERDDLVAG
jgi:hypothetical protein